MQEPAHLSSTTTCRLGTGGPKPIGDLLAPLGSDLYRISDIDFRESLFYALR
jgi:hypothetical protein